jgi:hypothetical protein
VFAAVTMTEILTHHEETGRLAADVRARCVEYLGRYGTAEAKGWAGERA